MHERDLTGPDQVEVLKFTQASPEVVEVEHGLYIWMRGFASEIQGGGERPHERRSAHEFQHGHDAIGLDDLPCFPQVVLGPFVVVEDEFLRRRARANHAIHAETGDHLHSGLELFESLSAARARLGEATYTAAGNSF